MTTPSTPLDAPSPAPAGFDLTSGGLTRAQRWRERAIETVLASAGFSSILITLGIILILLIETVPFFGWHATTVHATELNEGAGGVVSHLAVDVGDEVTQGATLMEIRTPEGKRVIVAATMYTRVLELPFKIGDAVTRHSDLLRAEQRVRLTDFFGDRLWAPAFDTPRFGIWSLILGTLVTTVIALLVAIPAGTISAIWLSEYCPPTLREILKPALELLAAVPTVVYGFFALLIVTPVLQDVLSFFQIDLPGSNMLSAGLVMGIMIIPYVASLSEDAMRSVPMQMREGAYAMGATRLQTALKVLFPSALSGITAAYILAISRAVGETMIVAIAAGLQPNFTFDPTEGAATISAAIVQAVMGDLPHDSTAYRAIFAAGLVLLTMTLLFNIAGYVLRKRYREAY